MALISPRVAPVLSLTSARGDVRTRRLERSQHGAPELVAPFEHSRRPWAHALLAALVVLAAPRGAHAGCNLIPQAEPAFRGALGTVDRPYAAPGDFVDVNVRQALCDDASPGVGGQATDSEVTLLFTPEAGPKRAVVVTTAPCASLAPRLATCQATPGIASNGVTCVQVNQPGDPLGMGVNVVDGVNHLRFRFPDTDALLAPDGDRRGFMTVGTRCFRVPVRKKTD